MGAKSDLAAFGAEVRRHRVLRGLSQTALSEKIGCSIKQLNNVEYARNWPSMTVYLALCRELGVETPIETWAA